MAQVAEADMSVSVSSEKCDEVGVLGGEENVEEHVDEAILEKVVGWGLKGRPSRDSFIARRLMASAKHCEGRRVKESEVFYCIHTVLYRIRCDPCYPPR